MDNLAAIEDKLEQEEKVTEDNMKDDIPNISQKEEGNAVTGNTEEISNNRTTQFRKERKPKPPLWICKVMVRRPKTVFGLLLLFHLSVLMVTGILMKNGYDIVPIDFKGVPLDLETDDVFLRALAWQNRDTDEILVKSTANKQIERQSERVEVLELYYESGNVFTAENFVAMQALENELENVANYEDFCLKQDGISCSRPFSVLRLFDGSFGPAFNDTSFSNIPQTFQDAMNIPQLSEQVKYFLGKTSSISAAEGIAISSITRSAFYFGFPLKGFTDSNDDFEAQRQELEHFLAHSYGQRLFNRHKNGLGSMDFLYSSQILFFYDVQKQVIYDMMLAVGSFGFIFLFMLFQTRSVFVTCFAIFSIMTSFVCTNLIYRIVLDYKYFGIFHVLSIFIILGIGADDVFVYFDTWRATAHAEFCSLDERLSECYRHASLAMLITSLTTMVAFISNAFSPLLGISSFGIFSAILVFVNYLTVITFFPTVVLVHHLYFADWTWPCCRPCKQNAHIVPAHTATVEDEHNERTLKKKKNVVVRFFSTYYYKLVTHKIIRFVLIVLFLAVITVFMVFMKDLKPDEESTKIFKDDHNYQMANDRRRNAFRPSGMDQIIRVYMIWGLRNQDRSACHKTAGEKCSGTTVWDEAFDLNPKPAQIELQKMCSDMQDMTEQENADLHIRKNIITGKMEVACFLDNMEIYLRNESGKPSYGGSVDLSMPMTETKVSYLLVANPSLYNTSAVSPNFYRYFETAAAFWLYNGYSASYSADYKDYSEMLGFAADQYDTQSVINNTGYFYGTRLRYAAMVANTSLVRGKIGYDVGIPIYDAWEKFFKSKVDVLPPSLSGGFQCTPEENNPWHWFKVQKTLADSARRGIIIGICLAFIVLTIATRNVIMGVLATITIAFVTTTIVGIIPMVGWKLGVLESLNLSLVVGLSVDYVVHLTEGYHRSVQPDRRGKVRDMLETVAVSVASGAASTLGASIFMLFAQILFFVEFGIFMFCTIGFSLIYSLGLFTVVLAFVGPEGNIGSLVPLWERLVHLVQGRKKTDETCDKCQGNGFCSMTTSQTKQMTELCMDVVIDSPTTDAEQDLHSNGSLKTTPKIN